ncbi:MAG: TIGR04255 family protein, partial [Acidobacteria bacterium]|nr:TIGR04255 family protein [Acidobacteriota bacterium]
MLKHIKYKNPPAIEVLFEIFFSETQSNLTLFGDFYQKIKNDYPRQEQLRNVGFEMNFTQGVV